MTPVPRYLSAEFALALLPVPPGTSAALLQALVDDETLDSSLLDALRAGAAATVAAAFDLGQIPRDAGQVELRHAYVSQDDADVALHVALDFEYAGDLTEWLTAMARSPYFLQPFEAALRDAVTQFIATQTSFGAVAFRAITVERLISIP